MISQVADEIRSVTDHLPDGATLVVPQVSWDDYEHLLEQLAERPLRVSYDCGRLQIVSPRSNHEAYARFFDLLVNVYADVMDIELEARGQTTWKLKALAKGIESDACYYVRNPKRIIGRDPLDLERDPPPDIAVEIDTTSDSRRKMSIYAALGIPELWLYDGNSVRMYRLTRGKYVEIPESRFLPGVTGPMLAEALDISKTRGQRTALKAFRKTLT